MPNGKYCREDCIALLKGKYAELERYPMRSDFSEDEVVAIKAQPAAEAALAGS